MFMKEALFDQTITAICTLFDNERFVQFLPAIMMNYKVGIDQIANNSNPK